MRIDDDRAGLPLCTVPSVGLHDAGRRRRGRQPLQCLPRAQGRRQAHSARGGKPSRKGKGFEQPLRPHEHRHVDVSYINICGTFFHLCSLLDGYSRFLVHWEIRESMIEQDVQTVVQRAREHSPARGRGSSRTTARRSSPGSSSRSSGSAGWPISDVSVLPAQQRQDGAVVQDPEGRVHPRQTPEPRGAGAHSCLTTPVRLQAPSVTCRPRTSWPVG